MFVDRSAAGVMLSHRLTQICPQESVVLGIARGGVPLAYEVARQLAIPLDVLVVRRLTASDPPYATIGAATEDGIVVGDQVPAKVLRPTLVQIDRQSRAYRSGRAPSTLIGRTAVVIDDGVITGTTARAACRLARWRGASRVVFAAPVMSVRAVADLADVADDLPRIVTPARILDLSAWYVTFPQLTDADVVGYLNRPELVADQIGRTAHEARSAPSLVAERSGATDSVPAAGGPTRRTAETPP